MALQTAVSYTKPEELNIIVARNNSNCSGMENAIDTETGHKFAKMTFCICLIPTVILSGEIYLF